MMGLLKFEIRLKNKISTPSHRANKMNITKKGKKLQVEPLKGESRCATYRV